MIKLLKHTLLFVAILFMGSCTVVNMELPEPVVPLELYSAGVNQQVNPDDQPTKAGIDIQTTQIVDGATVGIFAYQKSGTALTDAVNNPHEVAYYTIDEDQTRAKLNPTDKKIAWPSNDSEDPVNVRAYAPYQSANATLDALTFTVQADQSTEAGYIASDFLYAKVDECKAVNGGVNLMFDHLFTKVVFYLYEGNSSVVLEGATVKLNNVAKTAQIDLANGTIESTSGTGDITIHEFPADQSSDYVCSAIFPAHSFAAAKFMTITDVNGKEYTVSLGDKTFAPGMVYTYGVNVKTAMEIYPTAITNWEEGHGDLNVGGGDIQSMTFMSKFSEEYAIAYYEYVDTNDDDIKDTKYGYRVKNTQAEAENDARCQHIELNYLVRPAEMATTIANASTYWNDKVKVIGFYAQALTTKSSFGYDYPLTKAFDNETFEGVIKDVTASNGILTVKVQNSNNYDLKSDFYNELISAKLALTIDIDETNYTTKYVQVFPKDSDPTVYAQGINLNVTNLNLSMGADPFQLNATVYPADVTTPGVTFESSNTDLVTVTADGKVTPSESQTGSAVITVKANSLDVNGFEIKREIPVEVTFVKPEIYVVGGSSVEQGGELQLRVMVYPSSYQPSNITWSSADETLATVDGSGLVTGVGYENINDDADGEPIYKTVTITANVDGYTGSIDIKATPLLPKYMIWTDGFEQNMDMKIGQTETFSADITPEDAINSADENIRWWVQAPNEATGYNKHEGNQYNFTPTMEGTYTITVKHSSSNYDDYVYNLRYVRATPHYVTSIAFNETTYTMDQGQTWTPSLTVSPSNATYKDYTLTSSNPDLLVVSGTTVIANPDYEMSTANEVVTLTATSVGKAEGGSTVTATCQVTVNRVIDIIGWYYYTDGTCSETYNSGKTLAGVVFSTNDITGEDGTISSEYSGGLVVGIAEYQSDWALKGIGSYMVTTTDQSKAKGYHNTQLLKAQGATNYPIISNLVNSVLPTVTNASTWYIPSTRELNMLYDAREKVDIALSSVSNATTTFNTARKYWSSTQPQAEKADYFFWGYPSGPWKWGSQWYSGNNNTYYVRYIFAIKPVNP